MRQPDYNRRVVVTGLGVISPVGNDKDTAWTNLVNGVSGLEPITNFDTTPYEAKLAGEVRDFTAGRLDGPQGRPPQRVEHALRRRRGEAGARRLRLRADRREPHRGRRRLRVRRRRPAADDRQLRRPSTSAATATVAPTFIANALVDSCSGMIAIETGAIGHNVCMVSACATGTHNVGEAAEAIRRGDCIAVITGSTEAPLLEVAPRRLLEHARHGHAPPRRGRRRPSRGRST